MFYTNVQLYGKNILLRGVDNGSKIYRRIEYRPTFFLPSKEKTEYKTLEGKYVSDIRPGNIQDCREFLDKYKDVSNFPIYGNTRYEYAFISDEFPEEVFWDSDQIDVFYIDIEVGSENGFPEPNKASEEVTAITIKHKNKIISYGCGEFIPNNKTITYKKFSNEIALLKAFIDDFSSYYPDIITGWNVKFFDIPYLINRIKNIFGEQEANKLSPWKKLKEREVNIMNRQHEYYDIYGISILDYLDLYKKYSFTPQESYRLDYVASAELGEKKLDYSEHETLHQLYKLDFQKFMEYNIRDVELVEKLNDKGRLIELAMTLAYDSKVNYDDVFSQVRMWDTIIYNHLKKYNIVIPQSTVGEKNKAYEGAYVKDPLVGAHDWVASFDLNSLYPHLIMQYNISPETLIGISDYTQEMADAKIELHSLLNKRIDLSFLKETKVTVTPNKQYFKVTRQGFLPKIMEEMYKDRTKYKKMAMEAKKKLSKIKDDPVQIQYLEKQISRYNNLQMAKKVSLNSAYGAIGNQWFRFFDIRIAEAITLSGQLSIRWIENKMNQYLNKILKTEGKDYVIASDTDSIYLNLSGIVKMMGVDEANKHKVIRLLDKICEDKLQPYIDKSFGELAEYVNAHSQKMQMKRETLASKAIWTAKKRYILNAYNVEGVEYEEPKLKIMGLEAVKSSTPAACREKIKSALKVIMDKDENSMLEFIDDFRKSFSKLRIEDIAFPRSVNNLSEYKDAATVYKQRTPIHVKGSLVYNNYIEKMGLNKKYQLIKEGEKIKFCYLKQPNFLNNNTIAFISAVPKELQIQNIIDYDTQFDKSFLEPLKIILDCIGWKTVRVSTLESFFE